MTAIGHRVTPSLLARDLRETRAFYVDRLGFRQSASEPEKDDPHWIEVTRDGIVLQFYDDPPVGTPTAPVMSGTLYLYPDSVLDLAEEWRETIRFEWGPEVMHYGMREFAIRDPNGYLFAFTEPA